MRVNIAVDRNGDERGMIRELPVMRRRISDHGEDRLRLASQRGITPCRRKRRRSTERENELCYNQQVLDTLTIDDFKPHVGTSFLISDPPAELKLERVAAVMESEAARLKRTPFSLYFLGPADGILEQRIYNLRHTAFVEPLGIFLV